MKIVVAMDSLKGSLTSIEAGEAIREGILEVDESVEVVVKPLADGGEGTTEALVSGMGGILCQQMVTGPLGLSVEATYGVISDQKKAIIEVSQAAGLPSVPKEKRNPLYTTTYGVGEMIKAGIEKGCRVFIVGIGGSATNDAGMGMLKALGYRFLDSKGEEVGEGGQALRKVQSIDQTHALAELEACEFHIACDVNNPLYGPNGAACIYAPQKGATPEMVAYLDEGLEHFAQVVCDFLGKDFSQEVGVGAAGGLGFAFKAFLGGKLESGIQMVLKETQMEEAIKQADLVITGEGRLDEQTAMGKAPIGVAKLAKKYHLPVIGLAGSLAQEAKKCNEEGIDAYFSIVNGAMSLEQAMNKENARNNMKQTVEQIFRLIRLYRSNQ